MYAPRSLRLRLVVGAFLLAASCAGAPKTAHSPSRMKDSAPEKVAAQRAAAPHSVQLEQDDERWGIEAARERKRQQDAAKARHQQDARDKAIDVTR
jgi:hypothetical protein